MTENWVHSVLVAEVSSAGLPRYVVPAYALMTGLLLIGTFLYVRSWWGRLFWLGIISATFLLGFYGLAVQVVLLVVMAVKEVLTRSSSSEDMSLTFDDAGGQIVCINQDTGETLVYDSVDEMPMHVHAKYLAFSRGRS